VNGIRILFSSGTDPFSVFVRLATVSKTNHVSIVVGDNILHAVTRGVRIEDRRRLYTHYNYTDVAEYEILPDVSYGLDFVMRQLGRAYDRGELVTKLASKLSNAFGVHESAPAAGQLSTGQWSCARLAMAIDPTRTQIPEWRRVNPQTVTPGSLLQATRMGASFRRVA